MDYYSNSRSARRRRKRRRKILQAVIPFVIAVVMIVVIVIVGVTTGLFDSFMYSTKKADLYSYFQVTSNDTATVISNGEITEDRILIKDGHLYIPLEEVLKKYNDELYWEKSSNRLLYTTGNGIYATTPDVNGYTLGDTTTQTEYITCFNSGDTLMVCLDYVRLFANFECNLYGGDGTPYRAEIKTTWGTDTLCSVVKDDIAIRIEPDKESDVLKETDKGENLYVIASENEEWMKVQSEDLITGYIEKKHISDSFERAETPVNDVQPVVVTPVADYSSPVILAWHNVTNTESAKYLSDYAKYLDNINTISPTWFALADDEGTVASIAAENYVTACHDRGIKVWGLVDNMTYPEVSTYNVMSEPSKRAFVISQLISYANQYNLDGINVDFEMVTEDAGPHFVQFVRELCLEAHKNNLVVSVDNYVPQGYTMHYNRGEQGVFADYVIIMGYDEHTSGSAEAGSVASIDFVLDGIEQTVAEVPANKVINGLPFYTRYWTVSPDGMIVDMQTLPMDTAENTVAKAGAAKTWDEETNQNYAEWSSGGNINKIWLEDSDSLRSKLEVMKAKSLGGVAVWQLAYSTDSAWEVINEYYNP